MNLALNTSLALALASLSPLVGQTFFGSSCVDSIGGFPAIDYPADAWATNPSIGESVLLRSALPGTSAFLLVGASPIHALDADLGVIGGTGCSLYVDPFVTAGTTVALDGTAEFVLGPIPFGPEFVFQWVVLDPAAPRALTLETTERLTAGVPAQNVVFRFDDLDLRDPHLFISVPFIGCVDVTDSAFGVGGINPAIEDSLTLDDDGDGVLDSSLLLAFRPLDPSGVGGTLELSVPLCTAPLASTVCTIPGGPALARTPFTNGPAGTACLAPIPGTTGGYTPAVAAPSGPCFSTIAAALSFDFLGVPVPLEDVQIGGRYVGSPVTSIQDGLLIGFLPEAAADAILLPPAVPLLGGSTLSSNIRGGTGNCASGSDLDVGTDGVTPGWWFYFNFSASAATITL